MSKNSLYFLFIFPFISSILALQGFGFIFKAGVTLSCIIILLLAYRIRIHLNRDIWFILGAFIFSIIGDWFLSNKGDSFLMFAAGIGLYFISHAGYLGYALKNGILHKLFTALMLVLYLTFFFLVLWPAIDDAVLLSAVLLYLLISCFSLGASINLCFSPIVKWTYFSGIALVLFSDTIISFKEFTPYQDLNLLILPTYYAAHMLITFSLINRK